MKQVNLAYSNNLFFGGIFVLLLLKEAQEIRFLPVNILYNVSLSGRLPTSLQTRNGL